MQITSEFGGAHGGGPWLRAAVWGSFGYFGFVKTNQQSELEAALLWRPGLGQEGGPAFRRQKEVGEKELPPVTSRPGWWMRKRTERKNSQKKGRKKRPPRSLDFSSASLSLSLVFSLSLSLPQEQTKNKEYMTVLSRFVHFLNFKVLHIRDRKCSMKGGQTGSIEVWKSHEVKWKSPDRPLLSASLHGWWEES